MNGSQCSLVFPTANKIIFTFVLGEKTYLIYLLLMSLLEKSSINLSQSHLTNMKSFFDLVLLEFIARYNFSNQMWTA